HPRRAGAQATAAPGPHRLRRRQAHVALQAHLLSGPGAESHPIHLYGGRQPCTHRPGIRTRVLAQGDDPGGGDARGLTAPKPPTTIRPIHLIALALVLLIVTACEEGPDVQLGNPSISYETCGTFQRFASSFQIRNNESSDLRLI